MQLLGELHILGIFFGYIALGVVVKWIFDISLPTVSGSSIKQVALGVVYILPILGFVCLKFGKPQKSNKILGYISIVLWVLVMVRSLLLIFP